MPKLINSAESVKRDPVGGKTYLLIPKSFYLGKRYIVSITINKEVHQQSLKQIKTNGGAWL